jgi:hypothetical protein
VNVDVDLRDRPCIRRYRRVRRFGSHSGTHFAPYVDRDGVQRVGWHSGSHVDWYTIDLPVLDRVDRSGWQVHVKLGDVKLRARGDLNRRFRRSTTIGTVGGAGLNWVGPDGSVVVAGGRRRRVVHRTFSGFHIGNSIVIMDVPRASAAKVYLKARTSEIQTGEPKPPSDSPPAPRLDAARQAKRDTLLDKGDQLFVRGLYPAAALHYQKALKYDRTDAVSRFAVAHALFALGVYKTAGQNLRVGLDAFPDWGLVDLDLRKFYKNPNTFKHKLRDLRQHVFEKPDDTDARLLYAYVLFFAGERDQAFVEFLRLVEQPGGDRHASLFAVLMALEPVGKE